MRGCAGIRTGVVGSKTVVDGGAGDSVARESEGFGKRNRSGPARLDELPPYMRLSLFHPSHASTIYCSHSAGSQHKYVTPMAAPIAPSPRIPRLPAERRKNIVERVDWCF